MGHSPYGSAATSLSPGGWTPTTPGNLLAWFDATRGITESGGAVSQWNDQSGNGNHLVQSNASFKPTYQATGWNSSRPTLSFSNDFLENTAGSIASYMNGTNNPVTLFATLKVTTADAVNYRFLAVWRNTPDLTSPFAIDLNQVGATEFRVASGNANGTTNVTAVNRRLAWMAGGGTASTYYDATLDLNGGALSETIAGGNSFLVGTSQLGTFPYDGIISEILIYSAKLSQADFNSYRAYSATKWGG